MEDDRRNDFKWDEDVELIKLQFTDLFGQLKTVEITADMVHKVLKEGYAVDRFALEGLKQWKGGAIPERLDGKRGSWEQNRGEQNRGEQDREEQNREEQNHGEQKREEQNREERESEELYLRPDCGTYQLLPWESAQENVARIICDVCKADGEPSWADSRSLFKSILNRAENLGLQIFFDFQCEFYLFHTDDDGRPTIVTHEVAGYYDAGPIDLAESVRRDMILSLTRAGMKVESAHHGLTPGQHSFILPLESAVEAADYLLTFKSAVKRIAKRHGLHATFMPKPNMSGDGSGLHVGIVIRDEHGKEMTDQMSYFRAGVLKHLQDLMIFTNPLINSYKRLAAVDTSAVRFTKGKTGETKLEILFPDPAANPYLALGALVSAGIDGIENHFGGNRLNDDGNSHKKNQSFPDTLGVVIRGFNTNHFARETFGNRLCDRYLEGKRNEWDRFCAYVTDWETKEYLYRC